jgi:hypothetical protein
MTEPEKPYLASLHPDDRESKYPRVIELKRLATRHPLLAQLSKREVCHFLRAVKPRRLSQLSDSEVGQFVAEARERAARDEDRRVIDATGLGEGVSMIMFPETGAIEMFNEYGETIHRSPGMPPSKVFARCIDCGEPWSYEGIPLSAGRRCPTCREAELLRDRCAPTEPPTATSPSPTLGGDGLNAAPAPPSPASKSPAPAEHPAPESSERRTAPPPE